MPALPRTQLILRRLYTPSLLILCFIALFNLGNISRAQNTPLIKNPSDTNYLEVQRYFTLPETYGNAPNSIISFMWKNEKLWLGLEEGSMPDSTNRVVRAVNLNKMQADERKWTTAITEAIRTDFGRETDYQDSAIGQGCFFDVDDRNLYTLAAANKIRIFNLATGEQREISVDLPPGRLKTLKKIGRDLLVITDDRIIQITPDSGEIQIVTSKRRHPPVNILDGIEWNPLPEIMIDKQGSKTLLFHRYPGSDVYQQESTTGTWTKTAFYPAHIRNAVPSHTCDGNLCVIGVRQVAIDVWLLTSTNSQPLFSSSRPVSGRWGASRMTLSFSGTAGVLTSLWDQNAGSRATWNETKLWVFTKSGNRSLFTNPAFKVEARSPDADATIWLFDLRWQYPLEIPLKFKVPEKESQFFKRFFEGIRNGFLPPIYAVPKGLIIMLPKTTATYSGFWFIPMKEITAWCDSAWATNKRLPNFYNSRLKQFDENDNGVLDESEARAFNNSPAFRSELAAQIALEIIPQFDVNMDGFLDREEIWRGYRQALGRELTDRYMVPGLSKDDYQSLLDMADKNNDGKIDQGEFTELLKTSKRPDFFPGFNLPPANVPNTNKARE